MCEIKTRRSEIAIFSRISLNSAVYWNVRPKTFLVYFRHFYAKFPFFAIKSNNNLSKEKKKRRQVEAERAKRAQRACAELKYYKKAYLNDKFIG